MNEHWQGGKEKCKQHVRCKDCPEFEKYYGNGMCCYVYFDEIKESGEDVKM